MLVFNNGILTRILDNKCGKCGHNVNVVLGNSYEQFFENNRNHFKFLDDTCGMSSTPTGKGRVRKTLK